jgi:hypothetical protein
MVKNMTKQIILLKTENPWFNLVLGDEKTFELRLNDRDFEVGYHLILCEYDRVSESFSGRRINVVVTRLYTHEDLPGLRDGYVLMFVTKLDHSNIKLFTP